MCYYEFGALKNLQFVTKVVQTWKQKKKMYVLGEFKAFLYFPFLSLTAINCKPVDLFCIFLNAVTVI